MEPARRRIILLATAAFALMLLLATVTPVPAGPEGPLSSIRLGFVASRTPLGQHDVELVETTSRPMTFLSWDAILHNPVPEKLAGLFTTKDYVASISLQRGAQSLAHIEKKVGDFPLLGHGEARFTVVFLDIPEGTYTVNAALRNADGATKASTGTTITVTAR